MIAEVIPQVGVFDEKNQHSRVLWERMYSRFFTSRKRAATWVQNLLNKAFFIRWENLLRLLSVGEEFLKGKGHFSTLWGDLPPAGIFHGRNSFHPGHFLAATSILAPVAQPSLISFYFGI